MVAVQHHDCLISLLAQETERSAGLLSGLREVCYRQLLQPLRCKPECRGFDSFWSHYGPGVDPASKIQEYHGYYLRGKGGQCLGVTTLPPYVPNVYKIVGTSTYWSPRAFTGL